MALRCARGLSWIKSEKRVWGQFSGKLWRELVGGNARTVSTNP